MSLRETIEEAVNTAEATQETPAPATEVVQQPAPVEVQETAEQRAGRTAGRQRDEHGRLLPGKAEKPAEHQATGQVPIKQAAPPPSSWKKDHWESWNKIASENPQLAEYLNQREGEFAKGVSTYKQEYEHVKPLAEAIQPFMQVLQQNNVKPEQWISNMGNAHMKLVYGSPQDKLQMFTQLAKEYNVPLQALYNPQAQQQFLMQQTLQPQLPDVKAIVQEQFTEMAAKTELQQFETAKDSQGNPLYPHFSTVKQDMALLLESGKAQDLKSAYETAVRMNNDIWEKEWAAKQAAAQKQAQEAQTRQVSKAKAAAISPRSVTPGPAVAQATKGIRSAVEAAVEAHSEGGRV